MMLWGLVVTGMVSWWVEHVVSGLIGDARRIFSVPKERVWHIPWQVGRMRGKEVVVVVDGVICS